MAIGEWGPREERLWDAVRETIGIDDDTREGRTLFDDAYTDLELPYEQVIQNRWNFEDWVRDNWDPYWSLDDFDWDDWRTWYEAA